MEYQYEDGVDWIVVGGESGSKARVCKEEWLDKVVNQCTRAAVPVFVKQLGSNPELKNSAKISHAKGGDASEFPPQLQVRQYPAGWE
jgi:protein gp37